MAAEPKPTELKRLNVVRTGTSKAVCEAERLYKAIRSMTPRFAAQHLHNLEAYSAGLMAPYVTRAQDLGEKLLVFADERLDQVVSVADKTVAQGKNGVSEVQMNGYARVQNVLHQSYEFMTKTAEQIVEQLQVKKVKEATLNSVQAARSALHTGLQTAQEATDPDVAVKIAGDAWNAFAAIPAVAKLLDTAEPATKMGLQAFMKLHDTLVASALYAAVFNRTAGTLHFASTTTPYKLGAQYLYPMVQPVADPAISKVSHSKVVKEVVDYWSPHAAPVPPTAAHPAAAQPVSATHPVAAH